MLPLPAFAQLMVGWPRQADSAGYNRKIYGSINHMEANKAKRQVYLVELSITCHSSACTKLTMKGCYSEEELLALFRNKKFWQIVSSILS